MNSDQFAGKWKQIKGEFKQEYRKITNDEYTQAECNFDKLAGKMQEQYGRSKEDFQK